MAVPYQELGAPELCRKGDKIFAAGDAEQAAALYTRAFGCNAGFTMTHMRNLNSSCLEQVILTLEAWLDGHEAAQKLMHGLNKGLGAVFLSTLCPNNVSASAFKMESVLLGAGHGSEEIYARCSAFLDEKHRLRPEGPTRLILELTRALACLLSEPHNSKVPKLYLQAFLANRSESVRLIKSRHADHLPRIVKAFFERMSPKFPIVYSVCNLDNTLNENNQSHFSLSEAVEFLVALSPENSVVRELQAALLYSLGLFDKSAESFSLALQLESQTDPKTNLDQILQGILPERKASLLVARAAALFSAGGRASAACGDLAEGFAVHPATARQQFQKLFSENGMGALVRIELRQQAERGLTSFKETVLLRLDPRSSEGIELLDPVISQLQALCHLEPDGGGRELRIRLADCLLLRGEFREALSISSQLAAVSPAQQSYRNTVQVLRGFSRLFSEDHQGALEDFQAVIEHSTPHPPSCVRALCGRGLLRMMADSYYLTALDYITASQLQLQETALTVRCLVPWNYRGLLCTVLLEQGRTMLEDFGGKQTNIGANTGQDHQQRDQLPSTKTKDHQSMLTKGGSTINKEWISSGVHVLALLLMELQPGTDAAQILAADALYQLGRVEEAYRLLLSMDHLSPRSPVLARLVLLQLHRGFLYDANQLLKKLIQCGDTNCLRSLLSVVTQKDRALLEKHCHDVSKRILYSQRDESAIREAVVYLSIAIMASGTYYDSIRGEAIDAVLERARCYALLGQRKTAIFDFTAILKEHPDHMQALCGRGFTYLMLNQQKESTQDILEALQVDAEEVTRSILSLKDKARKLICEWLHHHCRTSLSTILASTVVPCQEKFLREAFLISRTLIKTDKNPRWHLLYTDNLLAQGDWKAAGAHLRQVFGQESFDAVAQARWGVVECWKQNYKSASKCLSGVSEKDPSVLQFLLTLIQPQQRRRLGQAASQEARNVSQNGLWESALALLTVAVEALDGTKLQHLRQRAACLAQLSFHERAVSDLDRVILSHSEGSSEEAKMRVEDLCRRGYSLLLCSREDLALNDFSKAMDLHVEQALLCVEVRPGKHRLAELFLCFAQQYYGEQQLDKAWRLTESGLKVDSNHVELRHLKAKIKREVSGPCNVH